MKILYWFRNNLRLQDNLSLNRALEDANEVSFIYIFDEKFKQQVQWGFRRVAEHRQSFLFQGLSELKRNLKEYGHQLNIYHGNTSAEIKNVYTKNNFDIIYTEEIHATEEKLEVAELKKSHIPIKTFWDSSLFYISQLPFEINQIPNSFSSFRKVIEADSIQPERPFALSKKIKSIKSLELDSKEISEIALKNYSKSSFPIDKKEFFGGEMSAKNYTLEYFKTDLASHYKQTRNELSGIDFSTKFSPWLSLGFISARTIFDFLRNYELSKIQNESTYWIFFELLWRDYFRFIFMKYDDQFFYKYGLKGRQANIHINHDDHKFKNWMMGKTNNNFINAAMIELRQSGFLSNRMRQVVASFLVYDLDCDWRAGSAWFESQLIDYDVYSNQGNWAYIAGLGTDPRGGRSFNVLKQQQNYDPNGNYIKRWLG